MKLLKKPNIKCDGWDIANYVGAKDPDFQKKAKEVYDSFQTGENSQNQLKRGIAWGVYARNEFTWLDRNSYRLSAELNPEEHGKTRRFSLIPKSFLELPQLQSILTQCFDVWDFKEKTNQRAYEVQLAGIRYEPTLDAPALPSPLIPHRDLVDGTIIVLNREGCIKGGVSRLYELDGAPLCEMTLRQGEGLSVKDDRLLHQVGVMTMEPDNDWRSGDRAFRDVLLVRFQKLGR